MVGYLLGLMFFIFAFFLLRDFFKIQKKIRELEMKKKINEKNNFVTKIFIKKSLIILGYIVLALLLLIIAKTINK